MADSLALCILSGQRKAPWTKCTWISAPTVRRAKEGFDNAVALPLLEKFVIEHRGYQALYARTSMSREDFRTMFDHAGYDLLRERLPYCRQAFDEVYDKVSSKGRVSPVEMRKLEKAG